MNQADGDDPTLPATQPEVTPPGRSHRASIGGYEIGKVIGEGGMGEVLLAHDAEIDRDVAIKRMRSADPDRAAIARFLREAKIQARLDHPAIVPVHEVGTDDQGRPYFTMKRITGTTLHELLARPEAQTQRLLRAFAEVCLAVQLAHAKGIVHRDLKPSNIMLGDYGEVYVLDWGVARVLADASFDTGGGAPSQDGTTEAGALLGTPGYMAPEQVGGEGIDRPCDVYALGCILFEILTRQPLHPRGDALRTTLEPGSLSPVQRTPERGIAPELDVLCVAALAYEADGRPSARELAERVQRYLDGDRDLEHRRALAATLLQTAEAALAADDRSTAMAAAGRALALDPQSQAAALITTLMLEPPRKRPPALERELADARHTATERHARTTAYSFTFLFAVLPVLVWNGITNWSVIAALAVHGLVMLGATWLVGRYPDRKLPEMVAYMFGHALLLSLVSRLWGPLIITPVLACMMIMSAISYPVFAGRARVLLSIMAVGWLLPVGLEQLGVLPRTWQVVEGAVLSSSNALHVGGSSTIGLVFGVSLAIIAVAVLHAGALSKANRAAQEQLVIQAWQLRQLLPRRATSTAS